jgi:hypothetical protein
MRVSVRLNRLQGLRAAQAPSMVKCGTYELVFVEHLMPHTVLAALLQKFCQWARGSACLT